MLRTLNWVGRGLGFAWVGVLTFALPPPHGAARVPVQIVGYCLAGAAALAWALMDTHPAAARYRDRGLPVVLGVMAVAAGFAAARAVLTDQADIGKACEILAAAQRMAGEGLVETRRAVQALRADTLPLDEELALVSDTYAQRHRVAVSFDTRGVPGLLPPDATLALLRIAQEALVNAAKHAAGQEVKLRLDYGDSDVRLTVRNDLDPDAPGTDRQADVSTVNGGYGLTGMRERLRLLNGTLKAGPRGNQWVVTAELPLPRHEEMTS